MFRHTADTPKLKHTNVTVRHAVDADQRALIRLALDSASPLRGPALLAESDARVIAALPLGSGGPIADPFEPTAEAVALLELRKTQLLARDEPRRRGLARILPRALARA